jgi:hypothetical protein
MRLFFRNTSKAIRFFNLKSLESEKTQQIKSVLLQNLANQSEPLGVASGFSFTSERLELNHPLPQMVLTLPITN